MNWFTPVETPAAEGFLSPRSHVMLLGSCFAENMGKRFAQSLPEGHVSANPFGVLYNPESIAAAVELLLSEAAADGALFRGRDGLWHSWRHAGAFSAPTEADCRESVNAALAEARRVLRKADLLCITFGTSRLFRLRETGMAVANCHKEPAADFEEEDLSAEQIVLRWQPLLAELRRLRPTLHIVFTVSPYRYAKWGLHESRLQKARLLLATDALCRQMPEAVTYFPAYELVEDELRDYRFYAPDLIHLAPQTEDYIWQRVQQWAFSPQLSDYAAGKARLLRLTAHRPLHADAASLDSLNERKEKMKKDFEEKWSDLYI
ncbi:MAG: GSCFA domain-containing protein [Alloprevotella sp.]